MKRNGSSVTGIRSCAVVRYVDGGGASYSDHVAIEEPLEIRLVGESIATTMRTPGDDRQLALGFLLAEGIIHGAADVGSVAHCGHLGDEGYGNVIDVRPAPGTAFDVDGVRATRRASLTTSACGVCGRTTIADLLAHVRNVEDPTAWTPEDAGALTNRLREHQPNFDVTGGLHAAAVFDIEGGVLATYEDIGRHNAVDKCAGRLLLDGKVGRPGLALAVSGRTSFEIVQKAVCAGIAVVAGVSAPSTLAIDLAGRAGVTLIGFARTNAFNVYAHPERVRGAPGDHAGHDTRHSD